MLGLLVNELTFKQVIRKYMTRTSFEDVDGETLLSLDSQQMESLGVKSMHTMKLQRVCDELREAAGESKSSDVIGHAYTPKVARLRKFTGISGACIRQGWLQPNLFLLFAACAFPAGAVKAWKRGEMIGSGAFGKVFIGLNEATGALMAVKEINFHAGNKVTLHTPYPRPANNYAALPHSLASYAHLA